MILKDANEKRLDDVRRIKRNCLLCVARKELDLREPERKIVLDGLSDLKNEYNELYSEFRGENRSSEEIQAALHNKRVCMDALDLCQVCNKEFEKVSRFLVGR